ncbi:E3 ubiquitin-protein ligase RNF34-like isoform X2 [Gigantopelta aegis]|uniref:E3 ubiquitin-protein ligase RNF34-like isoform X2 n=1 Tax=Gigantopelta aegis TaxID=1735272 RepID=UPI001B888F68|nr:E3 ubiquitin-protein ligase RNF34-like isoform X2 [Gigantopelta aegis]
MGAGVAKGHKATISQTVNIHVITDMACESCAISFTFFKRKKLCNDCLRYFCSTCLPKQGVLPQPRKCPKCRILGMGNFSRQDLMQWKVKDMRCFLDHHNIPTGMCREKIDLVDLLVKYFSRLPENQQQSEHERMVENLAQRMRQSNAQESRGMGDTENHLHEEQEIEQTEAAINTTHGEPVPRMKLEKISSLDDIGNLTARQLKEVLANNFVDYKGCCEKAELVDRVKRLWKEEQNNKAKAERIHKVSSLPETHVLHSEEHDLCKICMDATIDCVLLECGHMVTCTKCGKRLAECPVCRQYVVRAVHTFRS